ncbi:MAG: LytTR family DNA-binding domain-containing protein [Ignavibacteriaceae bacterium]
MNTVIIDDDAHSRKLLQILLKKFPEINVVGEASNITSAIEIIRKTDPDSVFLDICLDDATGFELMKKIKSNPKIVFVSAYDNYALRAFDVNALDYIQKPIAPERLAKTIERLIKSVNGNGNGHNGNGNGHNGNGNGHNGNGNGNGHNGNGNSVTAQDLKPNTEVEDKGTPEEEDEEFNEIEIKATGNGFNFNKVLEYDDRLFVTFDGISKFIKINTIVCITAEKDYSYIYLSSGKKHLVLKSMVEWEERLTPKYFVRIHRSTIVNLEYVEKVEKWFNSSYHVYLQNHQEPFKMSRRYAAKLKERFK